MNKYEEIMYNYMIQMQGMTKEEKIEYLEDCKFNIDMVDRWQEHDKICYDVVCELLKEVKENE